MENVIYLEVQDISPNGSVMLPKHMAGKPSIVMVHTNGCPHCVRAKPMFSEFGKRTRSALAVQLDSETGLSEWFSKTDPNARGVPTFFKLDGNGAYIASYQGPRELPALLQFLSQ